MPEKRMMILTADQVQVAPHQSDVLVILDLSGAGVFPEMEVSIRMLPGEARQFAKVLTQTAREVETGSRRR